MQRFYSPLSAIFALLALLSGLSAIIFASLGSLSPLVVALVATPLCMLGAIYIKLCEAVELIRARQEVHRLKV